MVTMPGPLAHVTGTCPRSNWPLRADAGVPWLRYVPSASWQAAHAFGRGHGLIGLDHRRVELALHCREVPGRQVGHDLVGLGSKRARGWRRGPRGLLLQAVSKHTRASGPSTAAQRFMAPPVYNTAHT
jgi:hypothetical protein